MFRLFIAALIAVPLILSLLFFSIGNREVVTVGLWPFVGGLQVHVASVALAFAVAGFLVGALWVWANEWSMRRRLRQQKRRIGELERRVAELERPAERPRAPAKGEAPTATPAPGPASAPAAAGPMPHLAGTR